MAHGSATAFFAPAYRGATFSMLDRRKRCTSSLRRSSHSILILVFSSLPVFSLVSTSLKRLPSGALLAMPFAGLPFVLCGALKIAYDLALLGSFRHLKPPEEKSQSFT